MVINVSESYICFSEVIFYLLFNVMCFFKKDIFIVVVKIKLFN